MHYKYKRLASMFLACSSFTFSTMAADSTGFQAGDVHFGLDGTGKITSIAFDDQLNRVASGGTLLGKEAHLLKFIVAQATTSDISTATNYYPTSVSFLNGVYDLTYDDGLSAQVTVVEHPNYATLELTSVTKSPTHDVRTAVWNITSNLSAQVADTAGVVYDRDFAIGMVGANVKTIGGAPHEYGSLNFLSETIQGNTLRSRVARNHYSASAARATSFGSVLQAFTSDFTVEREGYGFTYDDSDGGLIGRRVQAISDDYDGDPGTISKYDNLGQMVGSKIAIYGVKRSVEPSIGGEMKRYSENRREVIKGEILDVIHEIEIAEGLPAPTQNGGQWAKKAEGSKERYFSGGGISSSSLSSMEGYALSGGMRSLYDWAGSLITNSNGYPFGITSGWGGQAGLTSTVSDLNSRGLTLGTHTLPGFIKFGNSYIDTHVDKLGKHSTSVLVDAISATSTNDIVISNAEPFDVRAWTKLRGKNGRNDLIQYGYASLGSSEVIRYTGVEEVTDDSSVIIGYRLTGVVRGADAGNNSSTRVTSTTSHPVGTKISGLLWWPFGYQSLNAGILEAVEFGDTFGKRMKDTGLNFASFDGIEAFSDDQHGQLGLNLFYQATYDGLDTHKEFASEGSRISPFNWHFHNRYSWGEFDNLVLKGMPRYRHSTSSFMSRNLLPPQLAGFHLRSANEVNYTGSKVASWDSAAFFRSQSPSSKSAEFAILKSWLNATEAGVFSDRDRLMMNSWLTSGNLDTIESGRSYRLWDQSASVTYDVNSTNPHRVLTQTFGAKTNPRYVARPWNGHPLINIAPNAQVTASSNADNSYHPANAVDGFAGVDKSDVEQYATYLEDDGVFGISEWAATTADSAPWIQLDWDSDKKVQEIILFDRAAHNTLTTYSDVTSGRLEFSDGTSQAFANLPVDGKPLSILVEDKLTRFVKVVITGFEGTNPGFAEVGVIARSAYNQLTNLARGKSVISGGGNYPVVITDGDANLNSTSYSDMGPGVKSTVIDLGDNYMVDGINVRRYFGDVRQYNDVIYQLSTTSDFTTKTTVFNNDANNSSSQGTGTDPEFSETSSGHAVFFSPKKARYLKVWSNGSSANSSNHLIEVEVYGKKNVAETAFVTITTDGFTNGMSKVNDNNFAGHWDLGAGLKYAQIDIGSSKLIDSVRIWHYFGDTRRYHDVVIQVSEDPSFASYTTVFNNDIDNSAGFGVGSDGEYVEQAAGKIVTFDEITARYVRLYSNGSTANSSNHYSEIQVGVAGSITTPDQTSIIVDNGDSQYTETGTWFLSGLTGQAGSSTKYGGQSVKWNPNITVAGNYKVSIYKVVHPSSDASANIQVNYLGGTSSQVLDYTEGTSGWVSLGTFSFAAGNTGNVTNTKSSGPGEARADAVRFTPSAATIIVDNGDDGYVETGSWFDSGLTGQEGSSTRYGGPSAQWSPNIIDAGDYEVSIYKVAHANSDSSASIQVNHLSGTSTQVLDYTAGSSGWVSLGTFSFAAGNTGNVTNTMSGERVARADAVRFTPVN